MIPLTEKEKLHNHNITDWLNTWRKLIKYEKIYASDILCKKNYNEFWKEN